MKTATATKARAPKTEVKAPAVVTEVKKAATPSAYKLTDKQPRAAQTHQMGGVKSGLGAQWFKASTVKDSIRSQAVAAVAALGDTFTQEQAVQALSALPKGTLGSRTPRAYFARLVARGYIAGAK